MKIFEEFYLHQCWANSFVKVSMTIICGMESLYEFINGIMEYFFPNSFEKLKNSITRPLVIFKAKIMNWFRSILAFWTFTLILIPVSEASNLNAILPLVPRRGRHYAAKAKTGEEFKIRIEYPDDKKINGNKRPSQPLRHLKPLPYKPKPVTKEQLVEDLTKARSYIIFVQF